ncbi:MAG: shikimate kinase [Phycisphaerales bacterium JB050]
MSPSDRHVILMGLRGSGKSTIGRLLAALMDREFVDLDDRTLAVFRDRGEAETIAQVFERYGETRFREAEASALREALCDHPSGRVVLALGGGSPTAPGAADLLSDSGGALIYLRMQPRVLVARLSGEIDSRRPALTEQGDAITEIEQVFHQRDGLYTSLADLVFEDDLSVEETAAELVRRLKELDCGGGQAAREY